MVNQRIYHANKTILFPSARLKSRIIGSEMIRLIRIVLQPIGKSIFGQDSHHLAEPARIADLMPPSPR